MSRGWMCEELGLGRSGKSTFKSRSGCLEIKIKNKKVF